ncbi:MAG TPA: phosphotransferase [Acidimicrobiales bacterium]|nr:phosphotransferase [Acidimicrobiales bacterium]
MIAAEELLPVVAGFLPRQRWYAGSTIPSSLAVVWFEETKSPWPALVDLVVDADGARYQVAVGLRPAHEHPDFLRTHDEGVMGEVDTADGRALAYEATLDYQLGLVLLDRVTEGKERADHVRPVGVEQSNSSLVFDDRVILKLFRRLQRGPNPEVEVTEALAAVGFSHIAAPLATMAFDDTHLAVVQPYLFGGVEGWALAMTSLRDFFGVYDTQSMPVIDPNAPPPPAPGPGDAGGDFAGEAERLGVVTAELHLAMAEAFGRRPGDPWAWAEDIGAQAVRVGTEHLDPAAVGRVLDNLRSVSDAGAAIRVHGDYHLGQVMRTDTGWCVLDFEGEPARPLEERRRPSSPLRDVAGMLRSLHYVSLVGLSDRDDVELARAWEARNRQAFLDGYLAEAKRGAILPTDDQSLKAVLRAFELEKAVYELGYEQSYRPHWTHIPKAALARLSEHTWPPEVSPS